MLKRLLLEKGQPVLGGFELMSCHVRLLGHLRGNAPQSALLPEALWSVDLHVTSRVTAITPLRAGTKVVPPRRGGILKTRALLEYLRLVEASFSILQELPLLTRQ